MFSRTCLFRTTLDFSSAPKIADAFSNLLQRTGLEFDHVAIDIGFVVSTSTHLTREFSGHERDAETVKLVNKQVTNLILRRVQAKKSLALFLDGSEPVWNAHLMRRSSGKRVEERLYRRAGSPMLYQLERHLCGVTTELRRPPMEFIVSGSGVPGPAEGKLSAWMLDLATRIQHPARRPASAVSVSPNDSFCLIGEMDLFLVALGCTAFHNLTTLSLVQGEFKSLFLQDGLDWLKMPQALGSVPADPASPRLSPAQWRQLAALRTDGVLLHLLAHEMPVMNWPGLGFDWGRLLNAYYTERQNSQTGPSGAKAEAMDELDTAPYAGFLFDEFPLTEGGEASLRLKPAALSRVLARAFPSHEATSSGPAAAYLELLLQSHAMLCSGEVPHLGWIPQNALPDEVSLPKLKPEQLIHHLRSLGGPTKRSPGPGPGASNPPPSQDNEGGQDPSKDTNYIAPVRDRSFALTGIESLILSAPRADLVEQKIPFYTGGGKMSSEVLKDIIQTQNVYEALTKTRSALSKMGLTSENGSTGLKETLAQNGNPGSGSALSKPPQSVNHPAIRHYPAHYFVRTVNAHGPPPGWSYFSVNPGLKSEAMSIRYILNKADPDTLLRDFDSPASQGRSKRNTLDVFDKDIGCWIKKHCNDFAETSTMTNGDPSSLPNNNEKPRTERTTLRVLTWNVQFNRHSGERTPLGRAGINWCTTTRYLALSEVLSQADADVISMQEVESGWCSFLCQQPWVQAEYALSCQENGHAISPWGVMMLIRKDLNIKAFEYANLPAFSGHTSTMPEVTLSLSKDIPLVIVSSVHLLAPYNQNNIDNREVQLDNLLKRLKALASPTADSSSVPSHILTGDFNDTLARFFRIPKELGYRDAWEELHPHCMSAVSKGDSEERGYSIDGDANLYAARIIEPEFFGRPDRLLYSSQHLQPTQVELLGTQSVLDILKEKNITKQVDNPKEDIPSYLFSSDHFGVLAEFQVL
ncbi:unnamed protein product [Phytomonas sp. Hart1]|nr:unnamed protein product [Phytomonas sp. Hart1]|eukprot:CCW69731.1 unnamed protein product [Phytomonas sp. isolate Hart1]